MSFYDMCMLQNETEQKSTKGKKGGKGAIKMLLRFSVYMEWDYPRDHLRGTPPSLGAHAAHYEIFGVNTHIAGNSKYNISTVLFQTLKLQAEMISR